MDTLTYSEATAPEAIEADVTKLVEHFEPFLDLRTGAIGRVVGSEKEPAGSHQFFFWAEDKARSLDVGHIVVAFSEDAVVIGVVDAPRRFSDLRSFLDDYFDRRVDASLVDEPPTRRPEILVFSVTVLATKHLRDDVTSHRPPVGGPVFYATREAIDYATGRHEFSGRAIPALLHTNGNAERDAQGEELHNENDEVIYQRSPIWLDEDYLLGPEAGHGNWTGQSGLATKTSHVLFLISAIFQKLQEPHTNGETKKVAALMFNVKGPDLLWLDKPAAPTAETADAYARSGARIPRAEDHRAYEALNLQPRPFENLRIFAPFHPAMQPQTGDGKVDVISLAAVSDLHRKLNTLRNHPDEALGVVYPMLWDIRSLLYQPQKLFEFQDLDDKFYGVIYELRDNLKLSSLREIEQTLDAALDAFKDKEAKEWRGHHEATLRKAKSRFAGLTNKFGGLLTDGRVHDDGLPTPKDPFTDHEVRVIDIAHCNTKAQEVIVSSIVHEVWRRAEEGELGVDKVIVFVDELNKYAASGSESALRNDLVDIAARGRHLNLVLFGAQQFRSKVDDEILGNCGTSFYGRVGDEEITNASYRSLTENTKTELLGLPKGRLLARHAHFRAPLFGEFPLPPTIAGSIGQRLFNSDSAGLAASPGEALFKTIRDLGDTKVDKATVLNAIADLPDHRVRDIVTDLQMDAERNKEKIREGRVTVWGLAQNRIRGAKR